MNPLFLNAYEEAIEADEMKDFTPMSPEAMMSLLDASGISVDCDDQQQWEQCESNFSKVVTNLHKLLHLRNTVYSNNEVNRFTMESVVGLCESAKDDTYPPSTYSASLSSHQVERSLESIDLATILTIAAAVTAVAVAFYVLYRILTKDNLSSNIDKLENNAAKLEKAEEKLKETEAVVHESVQDDSTKRDTYTKIITRDPSTLGYASLRRNNRAKRFLTDVQPGGVIFKAFVRVNNQVEDAVNNFSKSFEMLEDITRMYYEADGKKKGVLRRDIATANKLISGKYTNDIAQLEKVYFEQFGQNIDGNDFFNNVIYNSLDFYEFYSKPGATWLKEWEGLTPDRLSAIDDRLAKLNKTANSIKEIEERMKIEVASKRKQEGSDIPVGIVDPDVHMAFKKYKEDIMEFMKRLIGYRNTLRVTVNFYNQAMLSRRELFINVNKRLNNLK